MTYKQFNLSFAYFLLGIHKQSQNSTVRGELEHNPLVVDMAANIVMSLGEWDSTL